MYPFNPVAKFTQSYAVGYESMTNDADVSPFFSASALEKTILRCALGGFYGKGLNH